MEWSSQSTAESMHFPTIISIADLQAVGCDHLNIAEVAWMSPSRARGKRMNIASRIKLWSSASRLAIALTKSTT
jgi:hypothetical protein